MADEEIEHTFVLKAKLTKGQSPQFSFTPGPNMSPGDAIMLCASAVQWCVGEQMRMQEAQKSRVAVMPASILDRAGRIVQ